MPSLDQCCTPCPEIQTVNVPGPEGVAGTDGDNGLDGGNAYTIVTEDFTVPACGYNVTVSVASSDWMVPGQKVYAQGGATFEVVSKPSSITVVLMAMCYTDDVAPGTVITTGSGLSPSGVQPDMTGFAASGVNSDITELTGLTTPLSVAQGGTGASSAGAAARSLTVRNRCLTLIGADFNSTADQPIAGFPAKYIIRRITATNGSVNMTTAQGGLYTGAAKTGTTIVAAGQTYVALTAAAKFVDLTIAATPLTDILTAATIYFSLTVAQGVAATGDLYIEFEDLS